MSGDRWTLHSVHGYLNVILFILLVTFLIIANTRYPINEVNLAKVNIDDSDLEPNLQPGDSISERKVGNKYVLLYNEFWKDLTWTTGLNTVGPEYLKAKGCDVTSCVITNDRKLLKSIEEFDALLFHIIEPYGKVIQLPLQRSPHQLYIAGSLESPLTFKHLAEMVPYQDNVFNWAFTYETYADVPWYINLIRDATTNEVVAPTQNPIWRVPDADYYNQTEFDLATKKTKFAAWMASNCNSNSYRRSLVEDLRKYIPVDIIGKCADKWAFSNLCPKKQSSTISCDERFARDYKFYFAFENSLCEDYVTEKLYNNLKLNIIPVVYGGANYSKFAPPLSYIDANEFDTTEELADYLNFLSDHPKEYIKYFWWRKYYNAMPHSLFNGLCELCKKLNEPNKTAILPVYSDMQKWWNRDGVCNTTPRIKFPLIEDRKFPISIGPNRFKKS